jgi:hypothetical protein
MERYHLKKLSKEQYRVESQIGSQLWKTYMPRLILTELEKLL